jgi:FkbM family methyltransferase
LALQQIALQDYPRLEAIVVDDSPIPMSFPDLSSMLPNLTVKVLHLRQRHSIGAKRNAAVKAAAGEIIVHWDVDDLYPPARVSAQVAPILRGEVRATMLPYDIFSEMPQAVFVTSDWDKTSRNRPFLGSLMYTRSLFDGLGGFADGSNAEDLHFIDRALGACNMFQLVTEVRNIYTRHQNDKPGPHNTWQWSSYERMMMLGRRAHRIERPSFISPSLLQDYIAADKDAAQQGNCEVVKSWTSDGLQDPITGHKWVKAENFPSLPQSCPHDTVLTHVVESEAFPYFSGSGKFPYILGSAFPYAMEAVAFPYIGDSASPLSFGSSRFPYAVDTAFPYSVSASAFPKLPAAQSEVAALPKFLRSLGEEIFGTQELLDQAVSDSIVVKGRFAGVEMTLRMSSVDTAQRRLFIEGEDDHYGLNHLREASQNHQSEKSINILDIGGNLGVTTIATFKKYPNSVRAIVVEPVPVTYFFLRWNLWLNGVPSIEEVSLSSGKRTPGVVALNRALTDTDDTEVRICYDDTQSMEARTDTSLCTEQFTVRGVTSLSLLNKFGDENLTLVKMDCEGCESSALPAFNHPPVTRKVERLVGELHCPDRNLKNIACRYDAAHYMTSVCGATGEQPIDCQTFEADAKHNPENSFGDGSQPTERWGLLTSRLEALLEAKGLVITEGHFERNGRLAAQADEYDAYAKNIGTGTVCEIGFNAGHSALRFLAQSNATVYEFDIGAHHYSRVSAEFLSKTFAGRFHITWGDSRTTVPFFHRMNPSVRCDLLIVDGFHSYAAAKADLDNFRSMAASNHVLIIDDTPCNQEWCFGPEKAWADMVGEGCIKQLKVVPLAPDRGFSVGRYTSCSSAGNILTI